MYICIEGIDGAGKTTQCKLLEDWLEEEGYRADLISEPTDSPIGQIIRDMLRGSPTIGDDQQRILGLLFAADRLLLKKKIEKIKKEGNILISDRCFYSSMAYQKPLNWIKEINRYAVKPDVVILLDVSIEEACKRFDGLEKFEEKSFLERVRVNYLRLAEENEFFVVDANRGVEVVQEDIRRIIGVSLGIL